MVSLGYIFYDEKINFKLYQQDKKLMLLLHVVMNISKLIVRLSPIELFLSLVFFVFQVIFIKIIFFKLNLYFCKICIPLLPNCGYSDFYCL